eukprot:GFUD01040522.1.p1 GENE.GFUD01040522.1~~GFUD01040522.1.p1  ORF type:complete len:284 (+),score=69.51 GFUD01040522.1:54-905(+)
MAAPNIQTIDLAHIRENCPTPTSDVKFTFVDKNTGKHLELYAHKLILAFGSEVFMAQFYGNLKEERDIIDVDDSSVDAFEALIDVMYNKKVPIKEKSFEFLAELFYLADKFLMDELQDFIMKEVSTRKIASENLLKIAAVAENCEHMERFSESVYEVCVKFIRENMESVFKMFDSEEAGGANSLILHRLMAKCTRIEFPVCENCKYSPCLNGKVLTKENFVIKAKMTFVNKDEDDDLTRVAIQFIDNSDSSRKRDKVMYSYGGNELWVNVKTENISKFVYKCA